MQLSMSHSMRTYVPFNENFVYLNLTTRGQPTSAYYCIQHYNTQTPKGYNYYISKQDHTCTQAVLVLAAQWSHLICAFLCNAVLMDAYAVGLNNMLNFNLILVCLWSTVTV